MNIRSTALALLLTVTGASPVFAATAALPVFVTAHYEREDQVRTVAQRFQHLMVDRAKKLIRTEATPEDLEVLRRAGLQVEIDPDATALMQRILAALPKPGGLKSIPGYACYRTVEETYSTMDSLVLKAPALASLVDIGPSWERTQNPQAGFTMRALRLTNSATNASVPDKADMVVVSAIHAREYTTAELMTRFAEWLVNQHGRDAEATWLLDNFRFHFVLHANPDGRKRAETGVLWRKNTNNSRGSCGSNSVGIDLNRNFPFHWNTTPDGSSGYPCDETYRGPTPGSEPETQNIVRYTAGTPGMGGVYSGGVFPDRRADAADALAPDDYRGMFFDIHSYSQLVLWSWGDLTTPAPNGPALQTLGRRLAAFNDYTPQQSVELYPTDGTTDDTFYGALGVPSYTIELGIDFFEDCDSFESSTFPLNFAAMRYAARNLHAPYRLPSGPDTTAVSTGLASVAPGTPLPVTATVDDRGFNQSNGTEPVHAIASARAYVDLPPWAAGAVPIPLTAADGAFNASVETVTGQVPTAGLSLGVHTLYVQGTDADGKPGTPQATLFQVGASNNYAPTAQFNFTTDGLTASFTDTSTDSDGTIASRAWTFGDGSTASSAAPTHTYTASGNYPVTLTVTDDDGASRSITRQLTVTQFGGVLKNGVPVPNLSAPKGQPLYYRLEVPAGATNLTVRIANGTGDADLYVRHGTLPTTSAYDCRPYKGGNNELCGDLQTKAGTWFVMLNPYSSFSGVTLTANYTAPKPSGLAPLVEYESRLMHVTLRWSGGDDQINILRNGASIKQVTNTGTWKETRPKRSTPPTLSTYKVCNVGTQDCSEEIHVLTW
ncbi:M14 family zinc carboxypeptidase [Stigmatella hybrida]|uniref:M14 family zinc carboxypeptidase n=1 Tax=Stigmatella hybrida TaxID=394097 RepID=UPI001CDABC69|nr:M14 family zinc carboxypeptidase [Stigmatella hybrida]